MRTQAGRWVVLVMLGGSIGGCTSVEPEGRVPAADAPSVTASVPLFSDLGDHQHPIDTSSPLAQRYFDQGLRLVYAFNHDEARRAFEEAARLDPSAVMPLWGVALTLGPNINLPIDPARERAAYEAVQRARALAGRASPEERAYVEALAVRYSIAPGADRKRLDRAYADAMRSLARAHPDDLDAATLFAEALMDLRPWDLWTHDGRPQPETGEIVATLEAVLAKNPNHPGANHYYIHAVEASPHPERALPSAERLPRLMPGAGHLVHMPAHVYMRMGRYADASRANEQAIAVDRAYIERVRPTGFYPMMYYPHNIDFLSAASIMEGRSAAALDAARTIASMVPTKMAIEMPMLEVPSVSPLLVMARFGRWDDLLASPPPPAELANATALFHFARGLAFARTGRPDEAQRERDRLEALRAGAKPDVHLGMAPAPKLLAVAAGLLDGEIAATRRRTGDAIRTLRAAALAEDELPYGEPPDWRLPVRHALGAVLLEARRPADAEAVYREDLARNPENGWALFGLEQSLRAQGKTSAADEAHRRFAKAFARADVTLRGSRF